MVKHTQYRLFTAYSDPEANELGTIYQACNWIYLGQSSGRTYKYKDKNGKWVSDRKFRNVSSFKRYAKENDIEWQDNWSTNRSMNWENIPYNIQMLLREKSKEYLVDAEKIEAMPKHKYCYIKGKNKKETKELKRIFYELNPKYKNLQYPKNRGK